MAQLTLAHGPRTSCRTQRLETLPTAWADPVSPRGDRISAEELPWRRGRNSPQVRQEPMRENFPSPMMTTIIRFPF